MDVIWHDHVCAHIGAVHFTSVRKIAESSMNQWIRENRPPIGGTHSHETYRRIGENPIETPQTLFPRFSVLGIGGHRPPLQRRRSDRRQQFLVDPVEAAVAEDRDDVLFFEERNQLLYDVSGIRFVERRTA